MFKREPSVILVPTGRTETRHVDRNVTVNRAPTDESVKLLKDMEAAAEKKLIESVSVGNTVFECVVHTWLEDISDSVTCRAVFKLNGQQMTAKIELGRHEAKGNGEFFWVEKLRDEMAKVIATECLRDALADLMRNSVYRTW